MTETSRRFWRCIAAHPSLLDTAAGWRTELADAHPLVAPHLVPTDRPALSWPCARGRRTCRRRVVEHEQLLRAVCPHAEDPCRTDTVSGAARFLHRLDLGGIRAALVAAARVEPQAPPALALRGREWWLGARFVAGVQVRFYFARAADAASVAELIEDDLELGDGLPVLLCAGDVDRETVQRASRRGLTIAPLAQTGGVKLGGVDLDLDAFYMSHRARLADADPSELLSERKVLILDPARRRAWLRRRPALIPGKADNQWHLLVALARRPGKLLARPGAYAEVFPEDYTDRRLHEFDWKKRLGDIWRDLKRHADWPVTLTHGDYEHGGYTLTVADGDVAWWSDPEPPPTANRAQSRTR